MSLLTVFYATAIIHLSLQQAARSPLVRWYDQTIYFGRFARFLSVAVCIYFFGPSIKGLLDKYFGLATLAFCVLLVGGFLVIRYLF